MPHRLLKDSKGRTWDVWDVLPERAERRFAAATVKPLVERRQTVEYRVPLSRKWVNGWLAFETTGEKRRLAPFPADWHQQDDSQLERLRDAATPTKSGPRRLIE
jgi:hypothetical protein